MARQADIRGIADHANTLNSQEKPAVIDFQYIISGVHGAFGLSAGQLLERSIEDLRRNFPAPLTVEKVDQLISFTIWLTDLMTAAARSSNLPIIDPVGGTRDAAAIPVDGYALLDRLHGYRVLARDFHDEKETIALRRAQGIQARREDRDIVMEESRKLRDDLINYIKAALSKLDDAS